MSRPAVELTIAQRAIVDAPDRIRLVRAGPGSGKTRVFVAELQRRLDGWSPPRSGIAALSFTNVAQQEIAERLGGHPPAPHFVGTLDAFMWRFLVRPFAHTLGLPSAGLQLVPSPVAANLDRPDVKIGPNNADRDSVFRIDIIAGTEEQPAFARRHPLTRKLEVLTEPYRGWAMKAKIDHWKLRGRVTHGDVKYLASAILRAEHGGKIVTLLSRRFPLVLVDELQDTSWFFGRALTRWLASTSVSSLLVGDPDQGIYGFGGADRALFDSIAALPGCRGLPLRESHRCAIKVAAVASSLARSNVAVTAKPGAEEGRAVILVHSTSDVSMPPGLRAKVEHAIATSECKTVGLLLRRTDWVRQLGGGVKPLDCPLASGVGRRLQRAVDLLTAGDSAGAGRVAGRDLGHLVLDDETPTAERLRDAGLTARQWRKACFEIVSEAASYPADETWGAWLERMKNQARKVGTTLGPIERTTLGAMFRKSATGGTSLRRRPAHAPSVKHSWSIETVHRVKGREFDAVVYFSPKPHETRARCPSKEWWDTSATSEEREIAFVMASRAKRLLILCVHQETFALLSRNRNTFADLFEVIGP